MADVYKRGIYLYINGQEVENNVKKITNEMRKLVNEQARMTIGSKEYIAAGQKIKALRSVLAEHQAQLKATQSGWFSLKKAADGFNRYFMLITSFVAGLTGMVLGFRKAIDTANLFEERLDNLSALTGLEGKALEWLGQTAKETSVKITESGIRIKQSASDIVDAYTKMGSQRPELLKNKQALAAVTEDAIILSEAAKSELAPAVAALATTMNQFNSTADQSRRIINILAAGSKEGAAEIPYLTEALEKSGTTANMMGLSIEQTVGMVEAVAPKFAEARIAGTGFDRVLLKMKDNNIGYKDGVFDMNRALDELRVRYKQGESAVDLFGMEHAKMAEVMLQAQSDYNRYTKAVTGSNVAIEQASINTNNNSAKLAQARNRVQLLTIELGEKLAPAMTFSTNTFNYFLKAIMAAPEWIRKNQVLLISLGGALLAYNGVLIKNIGLSIWATATRIKDAVVLKYLITQEAIQVTMTAAQAKQTAHLTIVQRLAVLTQLALNKAMLANPVGWVIAGLTALVAGIKYWQTHNRKAIETEREKKAVIEDATLKNKALVETYKTMSGQISNLSTLSLQEKQDLQDKIDKTVELTETEINQLKARRDKLFAEAAMLNWWQKLTRGKTKEDELANKKGEKAVRDMDDALQKLFDTLESMKSSQLDLKTILNSEALGDAVREETVADLEEKLKRYQTALKNVAIGGADYIRIKDKIAVVDAKLAKARDVEVSTDKVDKQGKAFENAQALISAYGKEYAEVIDTIRKENAGLDDALSDLLKDDLEKLGEGTLFGPSVAEKQNMADYQYWLETVYEGQKEMERVKLAEGLIGYKQYADNIKKIDEQKRQAQMQNLESWAGAASDLMTVISQFTEAQMNRELRLAGDNTKKREEIEKKYRQKQKAWAIGQAIIEGAIEIARINSNAGVNADLTQTLRIVLTAMAVARTAGQVAVIASQQFAQGKYPVMGADTGRIYQSAFVGPVRTGLYNNPSLGIFSEHEPEIVIDGPTTRNIQANYPEILKAINAARIPQYASGKYPEGFTADAISGGSDSEMQSLMGQVFSVLNSLNLELRKGIKGKWVYTDFEDVKDEVEAIRNDTTIG